MTNTIMNGISAALAAQYPDYEIYGDADVVQDLTEPCFFINLVNLSRTAGLSDRYRLQAEFDVAYFPETAGSYTEMHRVGYALYDVLEYITLENGALLRGDGMTHEIADGTLHFHVTFGLFLERERDAVYMETVDAVVEPMRKTEKGETT